MKERRLLKKDQFGEVWRLEGASGARIVRDTSTASWWARGIARALLRREAAALFALRGTDGVPALWTVSRHSLERSFIDGEPLHLARPEDPAFFRAALRLLRRIHKAGVAHNDLAKEPNLLVRSDGSPALIDFQLAWCSRRRGRLFRLAGREDLRHMLKHKRYYCPEHLTQRERQILDTPSLPSRVYMRTVKPVYLLITRRLLGWADREGAGDRNSGG